MLSPYKLNDYIFEGIADNEREFRSFGSDHVALGSSILASETGRVKALTMTGTSATTVELYINGRPQWVGNNPSVDGRTYDNPRFYNYQRGDVIAVSATVGSNVGTALLDTERYELQPRNKEKQPSAKERFSGSLSLAAYLPAAEYQATLQNAASLSSGTNSGSVDRAVTPTFGESFVQSLSPAQARGLAANLEKYGGGWSIPTPKPKPPKPSGHTY